MLVLCYVQSLELDFGMFGSEWIEVLYYIDDIVMVRVLVQFLLVKEVFDEVDMVYRFVQEYKKDFDRGYGVGVVIVFKKFLNFKCCDVFEFVWVQFNGKGFYGNGGVMWVVGIFLVYSSVQDVQKFVWFLVQLIYVFFLGYNGVILQVLVVYLVLQGEFFSEYFFK